MSPARRSQVGRKWCTISLLCPLGLEDEFAGALRELAGAPACSERQGDGVLVWTCLPASGPGLWSGGEACLPNGPSATSLGQWEAALRGFAAALGVPAPRLKVAVTSEEDWLERWKEFFVPVAIGETLLVRPPWAAGEREGGRKEVVIRPGLAFGTGLHATTKMCLEFLAETVKGGERVVDVGAGSGVLSIAACKLGAEVAVAVDNDPVALRECRRNCAENGVLGRVLILGGSLLSALRGRQDLLVCNIEAGAACEVASRGNEALKAGGRLILAGFTSEREAEVSRALAQGGFLLEGRRQEGPWVSLSARRTGAL